MTHPIVTDKPSTASSSPAALTTLSVEEKRNLLAELLRRKAAAPQQHPLSLAQERLWFLDQLEGKNASYNLPIILRLKGMLQIAALQASLHEIIRRHAVLRSTFQSDGQGQPIAIVTPSNAFAAIHPSNSGSFNPTP